MFQEKRYLKRSCAAEGKRWDDALDLLRQAQIRYFRFWKPQKALLRTQHDIIYSSMSTESVWIFNLPKVHCDLTCEHTLMVRNFLLKRWPRNHDSMANWPNAVCVIGKDVAPLRQRFGGVPGCKSPRNGNKENKDTVRVFRSVSPVVNDVHHASYDYDHHYLASGAWLSEWWMALTCEVYKLLTETSTPTAAMNSTLLGMCAKLNMLDTGAQGVKKN